MEGVWGKDLLLLLVFTVHMSSTTLSCRLLLGVDGQKEGDLGPREEIGPPTDSEMAIVTITLYQNEFGLCMC